MFNILKRSLRNFGSDFTQGMKLAGLAHLRAR